jgi:DNA-binding SARP family transcriptional activator
VPNVGSYSSKIVYTKATVSQLELNLLGIPEVFYDGQKVAAPPPKAFALLCYLATQTESLARSDLAEFFWGDAAKLVNVRMALSEFRDLPQVTTWLITQGQQVIVKLATDVKKFEAALHSGNYAEAVKIYQGDSQKPRIFLKGFENLGADDFQNWLELERSRLQQLYLETLQAHLEQLENTNAFEEAIALAKNLLVQDPLNEDAHRAVMRLEHKRGNDEAALAQFETLRLVLKEELGVEPLSETLGLLAAIEQSSVSKGKQAVLAKSPRDIPNLPEKLIGRESLIASIGETLKTQPRLLLQGLGGSGKTALAATVAADYTNHGKVLWLQAGDDAPEILLNAITQLFDIQHISPAALQQAFAKNKVALVVLDDVWNAYALSRVLETLPMIPVVVTSRQRYPNLKRMDVGRLKRDAAIELLMHHATFSPSLPFSLSSQEESKSDADTDKLCSLLGDHAFALRVAGITLAVDKLEAGELLERIQAAPHALKNLPKKAKRALSRCLTSVSKLFLMKPMKH